MKIYRIELMDKTGKYFIQMKKLNETLLLNLFGETESKKIKSGKHKEWKLTEVIEN